METTTEGKKNAKNSTGVSAKSLNWTELAVNISTVMLQSFVVGLATAAGSHAYTQIARKKNNTAGEGIIPFPSKKIVNL